jgi:hypothetical protein
MRLRLPTILAFVTLSTACGSKDGDGAKPAASGSSAAAASSAALAPAVDPKVNALARAVLPCKAYDSNFDSDCPAVKAWHDAKDDFDEGKADASLVAMLADADEKIRYLAAEKLNQHGKAFKSDKGLAGAVVTAAEKEKSKFAGYELGSAVGRILVRDTGTFERVKAMVVKHEVPDLRRGILSNLLFNNQDYDPAYSLTRDSIKDSEASVAQTALGAFWTGGSRRLEATCQVYYDNLANPREGMAEYAADNLSWYGHCAAKYDGLLDFLEKHVKAGSVTSPNYASSARHICEDTAATDKQRKRALQMGHDISQKKEIKGWIRASALDTVMKCDPGNGGRSFVGKFKKDPDKSVADKANELLGKK